MSSVYVRTQVKTFLDANSAEIFVDMSGAFGDLDDLLTQNAITALTPWVGIQFLGSDETPITVGSSNVSGKYREIGTIQIHVVGVAQIGGADPILTRSEVLRNLLRGKIIGDIIIETVSPPNFGVGSSLQFEGGWMSATFNLGYKVDIDL